MTTNEPELHIGISGAAMEPDVFELGGGLQLRKTYAHLMKPLVMAFTPAVQGHAHPEPWKSLQGGSGYDILIELQIGETLFNENSFDNLNLGWWIVALLRILCAPRLLAPIVSRVEIKDIPLSGEESVVFPLETGRIRLAIGESISVFTVQHLDWVKTHWQSGAKLMHDSRVFNMAFQAFDQKAFSADPDLYLLALWAALEALFSPSRNELRFRVSGLISTFLEPAGRTRYELHKEVLKLYDARSATIHGSSTSAETELIATHQLARRILIKAIEEDRVPDQKELERSLFGYLSADSGSI